MDNSIFSDIMVKTPNKNVFDLSHSHKTTLKFGFLVPILIKECLPNDTFSIATNQMVRLLPLVTPTMHDIDVYTHSFFVPYRLLWDNFEDFIRGPRSATDTFVPSAPRIGSDSGFNDVLPSSLANYLGLPVGFNPDLTGDVSDFEVSALPFAAYQKIYWDYFRDENLIDPLAEFAKLSDGVQISGSVTDELYKLRKRAWEHDYFTSALPFAQKGKPVPIPVLGTGEVQYIGNNASDRMKWKIPEDNNRSIAHGVNPSTSLDGFQKWDDNFGTDWTANLDPNGNLRAVINNVVTTIADLRTAEALQQFLEKNARAGNRYFEYTRAIFGQVSPDKRLQRVEYIGGNKSTFNISEVLQTSETTSESQQGNPAGHAINVSSSSNSTYHCEEHGFIMTLMSVRPRTSYAQGVEKLWRRFDRFDFPLPDFSQIGEQTVKNYELYFNKSMNLLGLEGDFGYLPRYAEMKSANNRVSGEFLTTFESWVMNRKFGNSPSLNKSFIECTPTNEIFPIDLADMGDYILADTYFNIRKSTTLPRFDVPGLT